MWKTRESGGSRFISSLSAQAPAPSRQVPSIPAGRLLCWKEELSWCFVRIPTTLRSVNTGTSGTGEILRGPLGELGAEANRAGATMTSSCPVPTFSFVDYRRAGLAR